MNICVLYQNKLIAKSNYKKVGVKFNKKFQSLNTFSYALCLIIICTLYIIYILNPTHILHKTYIKIKIYVYRK